MENKEISIRSRTPPSKLYSIQSCIGRGNFGDVYKAMDRVTQEIVAIKVVNLEPVSYTHLDVYKRQSVTSEFRRIAVMMQARVNSRIYLSCGRNKITFKIKSTFRHIFNDVTFVCFLLN